MEDLKHGNKEDIILNGLGHKIQSFVKEILGDGLELHYESIKDNPNIPSDVKDDVQTRIIRKKNIFNLLPDYIINDWIDLCEKLISWGCSHDPIAT